MKRQAQMLAALAVLVIAGALYPKGCASLNFPPEHKDEPWMIHTGLGASGRY